MDEKYTWVQGGRHVGKDWVYKMLNDKYYRLGADLAGTVK